MATGEDTTHDVTHHRDEGSTKMKNDESDRVKLRNKLKTCIDPLHPTEHPREHVHIVTGQLAHETVNVENSVQLGLESLNTY